MSRFSTYLLKQMSSAVLLITLMLGGMAWITQAVHLLELIGGQADSIGSYLRLTLVTIPRLLAYILPISLFCGVLYSLNKLRQESELIVMSATGSSQWQLAAPALFLALITSIIVLTMNLWFSPMGLKILREYRHEIQNNLAGTLVKEGTFHNPAPRLTIHNRGKAKDGTYRGLLLHDARDINNVTSYIAREGAILRTDEAVKFILMDGTIHTHNSGGPANVLDFKEYIYDLSSIIPPKKAIYYTIKERYFHELLNPDESRPYDRVNRGKMIATAHNHIASFLTPFALVLICLATILTSTMGHRKQRKRLIIGAAIALLFWLADFGIVGIASGHPAYIALIYALPIITITCTLIWLLTASDINRRLRQKSNPMG